MKFLGFKRMTALFVTSVLYLLTARGAEYTDGVYVLADVNWNDLYAYVYNDENHRNHDWPGEAMTKDSSTGYWYYKVPEEFKNGLVIINSKTNSNDRYPGNNEPGMPLEGVTKIFKPDGNSWEVYVGEEPGEEISWTLHFHNTEEWENIGIEITGAGMNIDAPMTSFLNSVIFEYSFTGPESGSMNCRFYSMRGTNREYTDTYHAVNGHVYTVSGDKGPKTDYDPNRVLPEAEYWLEPSQPTALDAARLYFNKGYKSDSKLRNETNIYIYPGLIKYGSSDNEWTGAPSNWSSLDAKYKMTRDASNQDIYYIDFSPSIAEWFKVDSDETYTKLAIIFRDESGNTKQYDDDLLLPLRYSNVPTGEGLGAVSDYETEDDGSITITSENGNLYLTPWSKNVIKVFTLRNGASKRAERKTISVIGHDRKIADGIEDEFFNISESDDNIRFSIPGGVSVSVEKSTSLLTFYNEENGVVPSLEEEGGLRNKSGNVSVSFKGMNDSGFYGGGYQGNLMNWEGKTMLMNNNQQGNWGQGGSLSRNICIPFYVSTEGYGVYFDDHYRYAKINPSKNGTTYESGSKDPVAYYYIGGGTMEKVLQSYTSLTGRQELPPYWALGYITSKFSFKNRPEAEAAVRNTKEINIPIDGIVFDIHWQTGEIGAGTRGMGKINWATSSYPNPVGMMKGLREQNVHTIAITEPYFTGNSGNYDYLKNNGYFADSNVSGMEWLESGDMVGLLDITKEAAVEWYKDLYKARTEEGIESWWLDLGEPERHDSDSRYEGGSVDQVHNEYGLLWNRAAYEAVKEVKPYTRFITMPRAGTSGMQRYNAFPWSGDIARSWSGLAAQVPSLVSAAMSGVSYLGSDIGGFSSNGTDPNLYRRWVQLGVFYPSMRTHSPDCPEVWQSAYKGVRNDVRDAINLRYAYLPYTYTQSYSYTRYGTPIARPANYSDIVDKKVLNNEIGAYYWGPDMYVAPVLDNTTMKHITFPEGDWLDMTDFNTIYRGHTSTNYSAPYSKIPRFMRRGSFIPRYKQDTFTSTAEIKENELIIDYFAANGAEADGSILYEDNHEELDPISKGEYLVTHFTGALYEEGGVKQLAIDLSYEGDGWAGMPEKKDILLRIHDFPINNGYGLPENEVLLHSYENGGSPAPMRSASDIRAAIRAAGVSTTSPFAQKGSEEEVRNGEGHAYYHDTEGNHLYIRIPEVGSTSRLALTMGHTELMTGIEDVYSPGSMSLAYGSGVVTYSAPADMEDLRLDIYTVTGAEAAIFTNLECDGYAQQLNINLPEGVYIAKLRGRTSTGVPAERTIKIII